MNSGWMLTPPTKLKPFSLGNSKVSGSPASEEDDERQADEDRQADPGTVGNGLPVASRRRRAQAASAITATIATAIAAGTSANAGTEDRSRQEEAAIAEVGAEGQRAALPRTGQDREHRPVPEEKLQQHRDVAEGLDIDRREFGDQPVPRQARDADQEADDRGKNNAEDARRGAC